MLTISGSIVTWSFWKASTEKSQLLAELNNLALFYEKELERVEDQG